MKKKMYIKFGLDILMALTFVLFFNKHVFGGLAFHEIAGLVIGAVFIIHILINWRWVKKITLRLFDRKLPRKTKLSYVLNFLLFISMIFIIISGIFISKIVFPNINIGNEQWFKISHISVSYLVLIIVAAHVGLHWKWVINVFKNIIQIKTPKPFLKILAKVAVAALLVLGCYQMYSTSFFIHLQGVAAVFNPSSVQMSEKGIHGGQGFGKGLRNSERPSFPEGEFEGGERPDLPEGFEGKQRYAENSNPLNVIISYFSIMSIFIISIYYIDKLFWKRGKGSVASQQ